MLALVQRVKNASVGVNDKKVSSIKSGYFILLGILKNDSSEDARKLAEKISKLRLMPDKKGKMNLGLKELDAQCLVVSQFTLAANYKKGNRPSFINALEPKRAKVLYNNFISHLKENKIKTETGSFGEYMTIQAKLDGPVTIPLDSNEL